MITTDFLVMTLLVEIESGGLFLTSRGTSQMISHVCHTLDIHVLTSGTKTCSLP